MQTTVWARMWGWLLDRFTERSTVAAVVVVAGGLGGAQLDGEMRDAILTVSTVAAGAVAFATKEQK